MVHTENLIQIEVSPSNQHLHLSFERNTDRTVYDICDLNGRILMTGLITENKIKICLSQLKSDHYVVLVLDGDRIFSCKFSLKH